MPPRDQGSGVADSVARDNGGLSQMDDDGGSVFTDDGGGPLTDRV